LFYNNNATSSPTYAINDTKYRNLQHRLGTSVDYWPVTAKQGEVHHPACSNANPNHNTNPNLNSNPNPNPTADL